MKGTDALDTDAKYIMLPKALFSYVTVKHFKMMLTLGGGKLFWKVTVVDNGEGGDKI